MLGEELSSPIFVPHPWEKTIPGPLFRESETPDVPETPVKR